MNMKMHKINSLSGFSLLEMTVAIIVIGILLAVAMQSMTSVVDDARHAKTERELEQLAKSIVGDSEVAQGGGRGDFGYVGDVGSFPPNLNALYTNPGSYATWDGPYLPAGFTQDSTSLKTDEWGTAYNYSGGITITSTGGGSTITKKIADASSDYLRNTISGTIKDKSDSLPGISRKDSVDIKVTIPNGTGGTTTKLYRPDASGTFVLDSIPVGQHPLRIIYTPAVDTIFRYLAVYPRHKQSLAYKFSSDYFSGGGGGGGGGITYVNNSDTLFSSCANLKFWITNTSGSNISVTSIKLTWSSPTAYYEIVKWSGNQIASNMPRKGSGQVTTFSSQTINNGQSIQITIETFKDDPTSGNDVNLTNTTFTIEFSDGSTFNVLANYCN